jgi:hypothetical protein
VSGGGIGDIVVGLEEMWVVGNGVVFPEIGCKLYYINAEKI